MHRSHRIVSCAIVLFAALLVGPTLPAATVELPAGSVDALAAALATAGSGGTVVVKSGTHVENDTVYITQPVTILGEGGAVIESPTEQSYDIPTVVDASLHVLGTSDVSIIGLEVRGPAGTYGNTGIVIEGSKNVLLSGNAIDHYMLGVLVEQSNNARIEANSLEMDPRPEAGSLAITVINGREAEIYDNHTENGTFGIWACDRDGRASGNTTTNALVGLILCRVPADSFLISGNSVGAATPARRWSVRYNDSTGNVWGYMVVDGSASNTLTSNAASGNFYDIELVGDSLIFGFPTPTSTDSTVHTGAYHDLVIKDCAPGTRILGKATLVDTSLDPCF